jgi:hypothetical protein
VTRPRPSRPVVGALLTGLALLLLCGVAVAPLLRDVGPCTHDGGLHYHRVVAMRHALGQGLAFTRWLPDLAFGYGYPFFSYRASLSYALALGLFLTGLTLPWALNLVYVLSILGCGVGAYLLARDLFGPAAGFVAAAAYAYAPYQFLDALLRGNAPESVALALMPFVLWAFRRLALDGGRRWFAAAVGLLVALYMTHNISSLLFTPVLWGAMALTVLVYRRRARWRWVLVGLVLAAGVSACLWLPALAEKGYVQLFMSRVTRNNDFHYNFLQLVEIVAPPAPVDTALMNPPMEIHLGLVQAALAALGAVVGFVRVRRWTTGGDTPLLQRERLVVIALFAFLAVAFVYLSTEASLWLWEHVPLLPFVQFPWRFVGRAALPVALLAGALFVSGSPAPSPAPALPSRVTRSFTILAPFLPLVAVCLLILAVFPSTYPPLGYCPTAPYPTIEDVHRYERASGLVGVDPEGSYFPVWVERRPEGSPLEAQYGVGGTISRFDETVLPDGAAVLESEAGPNRARLVVDSPVAFRARYLSFYFPGWRVWVDGEEVELAPSDPEGLMTFDVPAGRHEVTVRFGRTALRVGADLLSLLSLVAVAALSALLSRVTRSFTASAPSRRLAVALSLSFLCLLGLKLLLVDRADTLFRRPALRADGTLPGIPRPFNQPYADGLTLLGADVDGSEMPADGSLRADLYWTARERPAGRYQATVYLVGPEGFLWSAPDSYRPRGYHRPPPTYSWEPGRYALDSHVVEPLPGTPPGSYRVVLTVFDRETLAPLSVLDEMGQPAAPDLTLGEIVVTRPERPAEPPGREPLDLSPGEFSLLAADFDRADVAPGDAVHLGLLWRAGEEVAAAPGAELSLRASDSSVAASYSLPLPVSSWEAGDVWLGQHRLVLPVALETGTYTWTLALCPFSCPAVTLSAVSVTAPSRVLDPPPVQQPVGVTLGDLATLVGFDLGAEAVQPGQSLTVTLVWRAEGTAAESYRVFLHLLDPQRRVVSQSDGVPAGWTRPTTGWLAGEYVTDERVLVIPGDVVAGEYVLQAGLYVPGDVRLAAADGSDALILATIPVRVP